MNITFVLRSKRSNKSKRRTFAFKVRLLLFLAYREGTLNLYKACLSWLYKEILRLNITFLVLTYVGLWFIERGINITLGVRLSWFLRLCWFMVYRTRN